MRSESQDALIRVHFGDQELVFEGSPSDHVAAHMRRTGRLYEEDLLEHLQWQASTLGRNQTFIDVGAFLGTHSIFFAKFCAAERVLAFEPNPRSCALLTKNVARSGLTETIVVHSHAVGSRAGRGRLMEGVPGNAGSAFVVPEEAQTSVDGVDVKLEALDTIVSDKRGVGLIKIDVEGGELAVLKGASGIIAESRPILSIEVHTARRLASVLALIRRQGYIVADCLGFSPTYVLVARRRSVMAQLVNHAAWLLWAAVPKNRYTLHWRFIRLARRTGECPPLAGTSASRKGR